LKSTLILFAILFPALLFSQTLFVNAQFHYDFQREHPTVTTELLSFDGWGYTFGFADFNFDNTRESGGFSDVYFEIMRYFEIKKIGDNNLYITIQYNDGSEPVKRVWLAGLNLGNLKLGSQLISAEFLLKQEYCFGITWQYTLVWFGSLWDERLIFNGYLDFWSNDNTDPDWPSFDPEYAATRYSFQAEPQIGWLLTPRWKLGSELEISRGFLGSVTGKLAESESYKHDKWYFLPTIFIQYNF
jgi:hypothetical protein